MSNLILGIDLGTTNSCVAVKGNHPDCLILKELPSISVVTDRLKRPFTPSVLYYSGNPEHPYEIGYDAKRQIDGKYPPVMFAKRAMGTDKKFQVGDNEYLKPEEVSAEILKYLKFMAEEKLGQPIEKAVVTVPAYFNLTQITLTRKALEMAGFKVDDDNYILQEPVAAALTYTQMVKKDPLRIMVYDLGGGMFDITVLKKEGKLIEVVKFGGDPALGGYEFDKLIADYIVDELKKLGYQLDFDMENNPEDKIRYTKLLLEAERAKIALSNDLETHLRNPNLFNDQKGQSVLLNLKLERPTFESLISEKINYTMDLCKKTLKKSGYEKEQIDQIIMVGGSTYIPLIAQKLKETFGKEPQFLEPDLCVAIGAAVRGSQFGIEIAQGVRIKIDQIPALTFYDKEPVSGTISAIDQEKLSKGYMIEIANQLATYKESSVLEENGAFYFEVPLQSDSENVFVLRVTDHNGNIKAETEIRITQSQKITEEEAGLEQTEGIVNIPRPIYLKGKSGMHELAPEGAPLPFERKEEFQIMKKGSFIGMDDVQLNVQLFEEDLLLGNLIVTEIPVSIEEGDPVLVSIKITSDFQIVVNAHLPTVNRQANAVFSINIQSVRSLDTLLSELKELKDKWDEVRLLLSHDELARVGVRIDRNLKRADDCLKGNDPDTTEASRVVNNLKRIIDELNEKAMIVLQPSKDRFDNLCVDVKQLTHQAEQVDPNAVQMGMNRTLEALIEQSRLAYQQRDQRRWHNTYRQVEDLGGRAWQIIRNRFPAKLSPPDPFQLLIGMNQLLNEIREEANQKQSYPQYPRWMKEIAEIQAEIRELDKLTDEDKLMKEIRSLYLQKMLPLQEQIRSNLPDDRCYEIRSNLPDDGCYAIHGAIHATDGSRKDDLTVEIEKKSTISKTHEMPTPLTDRVHFSVTAPLVMQKGMTYVIDVWAHIESQRMEVQHRARQSLVGKDIMIKTKGPVKVVRGTILTVRLKVDALIIDEPEDTILWEGEIGNANFGIAVPKETQEGIYPGIAIIYADGLLQIAKLKFLLNIGKETAVVKNIVVDEKRYSTAFASYASKDRKEVLSVIQGIQKALPNLEVFTDIMSLRSGQKFEEEIFKRIDTSDIFYLFWSKAARQSKWVDKEWRYAYINRGIDYIDPVPLQTPEIAPPPKELAEHLHFNDRTTVYKNLLYLQKQENY